MPSRIASARRSLPRAAALALAVSFAGAVTGMYPALASAAVATSSAPAAPTVPAGFSVQTVATGPTGQSSPDDITRLGNHLFVAYQNGVGSDGKASPKGATKSTIVEYTLAGQQLASWSVTGKVDGMGADADGNRVIATVNEDGNSSLYTVTPSAAASAQLQHFAFQGMTHGGGTDSVLVTGGKIYLTGSAPAADADGKTYSKPALYTAVLTPAAGGTGTVALTPVLSDNAVAKDAVTGKSTKLNLSDPDSSEHVPAAAPRFGGDLLLDSQGDKQLIFQNGAQTPTVLNLNTQVDDTTFATGSTGTLYVVDSKNDKILAITGQFTAGQAFTSVPGDSTTLPGTLGTLDTATGTVSSFAKLGSPKGLLFTPETLAAPVGSGGSSSSAQPSASASASGPALAATGAGATLPIAGAAVAALVLGGGAVLIARRRAGRRS
ncbi:hypothetical protein ABIA32_002385 [Streptacidiphilus sp. MAP12-20]|uniref:hypothetical protein n=1 Tax=Streptacidiphilus sp. MAP12-20 TaxID=3156299 RepID=UPI003518D533